MATVLQLIQNTQTIHTFQISRINRNYSMGSPSENARVCKVMFKPIKEVALTLKE